MTREKADIIAEQWNEQESKHTETYRSHAEATGEDDCSRVEIRFHDDFFCDVERLSAYAVAFGAMAFVSIHDGKLVAVLN